MRCRAKGDSERAHGGERQSPSDSPLPFYAALPFVAASAGRGLASSPDPSLLHSARISPNRLSPRRGGGGKSG